MTQSEMVFNYLQEHEGGITSWEAIQFFHITRLAARISDLEQQGYRFRRERVEKVVNGKIQNFTRYFLDDNHAEDEELS